MVPTNPAAAGVNADIRWNGAKKVTSDPPGLLLAPPPNLVSHSPVRSGTVSFSPSLPSEVAGGPASSCTFSAEAVEVINMGMGGGRIIFVCVVVVVDEEEAVVNFINIL